MQLINCCMSYVAIASMIKLADGKEGWGGGGGYPSNGPSIKGDCFSYRYPKHQE